MKLIFTWLRVNWISLLSLFISISCAYITWKGYLKSRVKLKIISLDQNYSLGYTYYRKRIILFIHLKIDNISTSDTDISGAEIEYEGQIYHAEAFPSDWCNSNSEHDLIFNYKDDLTLRPYFDLRRENLLFQRVIYQGTVSGYLTFLDFPLIESDVKLKLLVHTPIKSFKCVINVSPFPDNILVENRIRP